MNDIVAITIDRRFLEHPTAHHLRKMRAAVWLYLVLLSRLEPGTEVLDITPSAIAASMGLREGTIRSWLGHLRRGRYVDVARSNGGYRVRVRHLATPAKTEPSGPVEEREVPDRFFTFEKTARALGSSPDDEALATALKRHPDDAIRRALAGALAVPAEEIRRSRTALFLYLLKRHAEED